jgi:predicted alpha/beta-hydrolase family hydrolase
VSEQIMIDTSHGPARANLHLPTRGAAPSGLLVLGHGAGGGVGARDLVQTTDVAIDLRCAVALVEQPYRVAGRRSPAPAHQLDAAWVAVVDALKAQGVVPAKAPLITGGRSSGARVACRTAADTGAVGVLCLAFPLHGLRREGVERPTRLPELEAVEVPVLVIQGAGDPFGMPPAGPDRIVVQVKGNHSLTSDMPALAEAVEAWLMSLLAARGTVSRGGRAARAARTPS